MNTHLLSIVILICFTGKAGVLALLFLLNTCLGVTTTPSFLSAAERSRLNQVFTSAIDVNDLAATFYAVQGLKLQGATIPNDKVFSIWISWTCNAFTSVLLMSILVPFVPKLILCWNQWLVASNFIRLQPISLASQSDWAAVFQSVRKTTKQSAEIGWRKLNSSGNEIFQLISMMDLVWVLPKFW